MGYGTFKEIRDLTKKRINFTDVDEQVDGIINEAINHAYIYDLSVLEPSFNTTVAPVVYGVAALPEDLHSIEKITPTLLDTEYRKGNAIISDRDITFSILYIVSPEPLVDDTEEPVLSSKARYLLSTYACSEYYTFKKNLNVADYYMKIYEKQKKKIAHTDNIEKTVPDTTGGW